jgi:four helix bundle protein
MTIRDSVAAASGPRQTVDPLVRLRAYQVARTLADEGATDAARLAGRTATRLVAGQLLRALGSVAANIAEGYSRSTGPDRARFFEYALGSARESREWYRSGQFVLGAHRTGDRLARLDALVALLVGLVRRSRCRSYRADLR